MDTSRAFFPARACSSICAPARFEGLTFAGKRGLKSRLRREARRRFHYRMISFVIVLVFMLLGGVKWPSGAAISSIACLS